MSRMTTFCCTIDIIYLLQPSLLLSLTKTHHRENNMIRIKAFLLSDTKPMEGKEACNPAMLQENSLVFNNENVGDSCRGVHRGGGG